MKLIRAIFPDSDQAALWRDGRKYPRFVRTYEGSGENRMADSYLLHALDTETDLPELLILLGALAASPRTLEQLRRSAEREMHRRGLALPAQSLLLRHNVSACVFDEDIVWQLQELIAARGAP